MFYNYEHKDISIKDLYKNQSCFLICSGRSLNDMDLDLLRRPGIVTFGLNNSPRVFRPDLWTSGDNVGNFISSIYKDPKIKKFITYAKRNDYLFDNFKWEQSQTKVMDCPNVIYYHMNDDWNEKTYLSEDGVSWGRKRDDGGCRSVMMAAVKIIYSLGFRKLFIIGADFKMDENNKYAFKQDRTQGSIRNNNNAYKKLNERFTLLRPYFEENNFHVFNCTPDSGLKSFDYIDYKTAIDIAVKDFPDVVNERTEGLYERLAVVRHEEFKKTHGIIYYNSGKKYLTRLCVSLSSLRNVYKDSVTILCDEESYDDCKTISEKFDTDIISVDFSSESRNDLLFNKCLLHKYTPYETSLYLDADTLVVKNTITKLFKEADLHEFVAVQFADWTPKNIEKRIAEWSNITDISKAMEHPYAINTGVFAFKKDSCLVKDWYDLAIKGEKFFIPDEISCQIMLPRYNHCVVGASFNTSCKFGKIWKRTAIIHYHGNKHCRIENGKYLYHSDMWYKEFDIIKDFVKDYIKYDTKLGEYIGFHNSNCCNA